jgi:hypothetical protein
MILYLFVDRMGFPRPAIDYIIWQFKQPLSTNDWILIRIGDFGMICFAASTVGLMFFRSLFRFFYLISVFLMLISNLMYLPIIINGFQMIVENILMISIGFTIALIFLPPVCFYFKPRVSATEINGEIKNQ